VLSTGSTPGGALPSIPLSFNLATILPPEPRNLWFPGDLLRGTKKVLLRLSFLINENILGKCFRSWSSCQDLRISPLPRQYECPRLSLLIITSALKTNKIEPKSYSIIPCCRIQAKACFEHSNLSTGAGITAAAGTRLALQLILVKFFRLHSFPYANPCG